MEKLLQKTKRFTTDALEVFDADTVEGKRLNLLNDACVLARYNDKFKGPKEDMEKRYETLGCLQEVTKKICLETITEHEKRAKQ